MHVFKALSKVAGVQPALHPAEEIESGYRGPALAVTAAREARKLRRAAQKSS